MEKRVIHPKHYNSHPSGVECIDIIRYYDFNVGSVFKYLWRCGLKTEEGMTIEEKELEDMEKALFCLIDEIRDKRIKLYGSDDGLKDDLVRMAEHYSNKEVNKKGLPGTKESAKSSVNQ